MESKHRNMSVLMFPWLGHGHISPFLELAKKLDHKNFNIYFCSTPANLSSIERKFDDHIFSIKFVELHLPTLPDLPPHRHTTNGLPPNLMGTLRQAFDMSKPNFSNILKTLKLDLLIYDCLQPWAQEEAASLNIPAIQFVTNSTVMTCVLFHAIYCPGTVFPFSNIYFRDYEGELVIRLRKFVEDHWEGNNPMSESIEKSNDIVLIKGVKEIDEKYSDYLSVLIGKKIVHVGPLVQDVVNDDEDLEIIQWLNNKEKGSTVFVSFGSEYFLSDDEFMEIAHGLMLVDNVNFIWVVRFPLGENIGVEDALPLGFYDKVGDRGLVLEGWAPQAKILGHVSIGGFVSHCGWSSVIESMSFGVPIIAIPMQLDQPINSRLVANVGTGIEVLRDENRRLDRVEVARVIKEVVVQKEGEHVRKKAKELGDSIRVQGDDEKMDEEVVKELMKLRLKRTD